MGTQVVQNQRTQLLASAWQQVEGILEANQKSAGATRARHARPALLEQVGKATTETVLNLTSPIQGRVREGAKTVRGLIRESRVPERVLSQRTAGLRGLGTALSPLSSKTNLCSGK